MLSVFRVLLVLLRTTRISRPDRCQTPSKKCSEKMHEGNKKNK